VHEVQLLERLAVALLRALDKTADISRRCRFVGHLEELFP
jgi:hypothetical protein